MKTKFYHSVLVLLLCIFTGIYNNGCSVSDAPSLVATSNSGVLYGYVGLYYTYPTKDTLGNETYGPSNNINIVVSIVGSNITTTTDSLGNWKLSGLDSGAYSIRFTHEGYDTLTLSNIRTNGHDSNEVKITPYGGVFLAEYIKPVFDTVKTWIEYEKFIDHIAKDTFLVNPHFEGRAKVNVTVLGKKDVTYKVLVFADTVATVSNVSYLVQDQTRTPSFDQDTVYFSIGAAKIMYYMDSLGQVTRNIAHNRDIYYRLYPEVKRRNKFEILPPSKVYHVRIP